MRDNDLSPVLFQSELSQILRQLDYFAYLHQKRLSVLRKCM